jgi:mannose-1-phosphate guanylyltransferase/phosphomannomutase
VRSAGAHLGAVIDPDGERITLIDDSGHVLTDDEALFALLHLVCAASDEPVKVAVPVTVSREVERFAAEQGAEVVWTKLSTSNLMEVAAQGDVDLAAGQEGGFIFPRFLPAYDATAALVNLLALLAKSGLRLSKVVETAPRSHVAHETVPTPWEQKGLVMRTLVETSTEELVLVDGVKVLRDDGWILVLPDPEDPITHVWAEGNSDREAKSFVQEYTRRIRHMIR